MRYFYFGNINNYNWQYQVRNLAHNFFAKVHYMHASDDDFAYNVDVFIE